MSECDRWVELSDRQACEETLSPEEERFYRHHADTCDACEQERAMWGLMAELAPADAPVEQERREPTPPRRLPWLLAAGGLAAAAAAMVWPRPPASLEMQAWSTPSVAAPPAESSGWTAVAASGDAIDATDGVEGGRLEAKRGQLCARHDSGVVVCATAHTRATLHGADVQPYVHLIEGRVVVELEPRAARPFFVETARGRAVALGTTFSVTERGEVRVTHGRVRWHAGDTSVVLDAREAWLEGRRQVLPSDDADRDRRALRGALLWRGGPSGELRLGGEEGCQPELDGQRLDPGGMWLRVPPGPRTMNWSGCPAEPQTIVVRPGARVKSARAEEEKRSDDGGAATDAGSQTDESPASPSAAATILADAQRQRAAGDLDEALGSYLRLLRDHPRSREAAVAQLSVGRIYLQQGRGEEALASFEGYLARGGGLSQEAKLGRIAALGALGREEERRRAIVSFLADHPDSTHAEALRPQIAP